MSLDTYANLQTAIIDFSHRTDLSAQIPDFIRLAEDKVYAQLESNQQDTKVTLATVANQEYVTLPTDFMDFRSIAVSLNSISDTLTYVTPDQYQSQYRDTQTGMPRVYTLIDSVMYMRPIPNAVYSLSAIYTASFTSLSGTNTTNWLLTRYPSIYLYASLEQLAMYIKTDATAFESEWQRIVAGINVKDWNDSATMQVKTDVNLSI